MLLLLLLAAAPALSTSTPSADDVARARTHFQAGKTHYQLGQYSEAVREFAAGYALSPRPEFLINLGQAYRGAGQPREALDMFEKYLAKAPAEARERTQVEQLAGQLRAELAEIEAKAQAQAAAERQRAADAPRVTELTPPPAPPAPELKAAPQPVSPLAWAIPIGIAIAGGVAAAIIIGVTNPVQCTGAAGLGCVDLRSQ